MYMYHRACMEFKGSLKLVLSFHLGGPQDTGFWSMLLHTHHNPILSYLSATEGRCLYYKTVIGMHTTDASQRTEKEEEGQQ